MKHKPTKPQVAPSQANVQANTQPNTQPNTQQKQAVFDQLMRGLFRKEYDQSLQTVLAQRQAQLPTDQPLQVQNPLTPATATAPLPTEQPSTEGEIAFYQAAQKDAQLAKLEQENAMLRETLRRVHATSRVLQWSKQADAVTREYPDFNLHQEMQNPQFCQLLLQKSGAVDVKKAYEMMHFDTLKQDMMQKAVAQTTQKMQTRAQRPAEGGLDARTLPADGKKLSVTDRKKLAQRVAKGEMIPL